METIVILALASLTAAIVPHLPIKWYVEWQREKINKEQDELAKKNKAIKSPELKSLTHIPRHMGLIERPIFVLSWYLGQPEFIGLWLTLKVAGGFGMWNPQISDLAHIGRARFMIQMIGNALSVASAVLIALYAIYLIDSCTDKCFYF